MTTLPLRAAIYARKSTNDNDKSAEDKSVARQKADGLAFIKRCGWQFAGERHYYEDDGVGGAEFKKRDDLNRLLADIAKPGARPFDVLVIYDYSRLGRDMSNTANAYRTITEAGVRIFFSQTNEELKLETEEQELMLSVKGFGATVERRQAVVRCRDKSLSLAQAGRSFGGRCYGYDNIWRKPDGSEQIGSSAADKAHSWQTILRINPVEADVIRRICRAFVAGHGHVSIAKSLNGEPRYAELLRKFFNGQRPAPPRKGTGSWAPSSVHKILRNERYTGTMAWGRYRKEYKKGTKARVRRAEKDILRIQRPDLRIVPEKLWKAVQERVAAGRTTYLRDTRGHLWGRRGAGVESKYLLTGLAECGCCGHNMAMIGGRRSYLYYGCAYHQSRGRTICSNGLHVRTVEADALVIEKIRGVLTPAAFDYTIDQALKLRALHALEARDAQRREQADTPERLEAEARKLRRELDRFMALIAGGTAPASIMAEINRREARLAAIEVERARLVAVDDEGPLELDVRRMRKGFRERLVDLHGLLKSDIPLARQALRKLLADRISFRPVERNGARGYDLSWKIVTGALLSDSYISLASPRGFEPRLPP